MVDLYARKPLERAVDDVIVLPNADEGGIWVKPWDNGIVNHWSVKKFKDAARVFDFPILVPFDLTTDTGNFEGNRLLRSS